MMRLPGRSFRFGSPRLLRLLGVLSVVTVVMLGAVVYSTRGGTVAMCLMTQREGRPIRQYDLQTGHVLTFRSGPPRQPAPQLQVTSPDTQYQVALKPDAPSSPQYDLWVENVNTQQATRVELFAALQAPVRSGGFTTYNAIWAPDSSRFAYLWATDKIEESFIVTSKADGTDSRRLDGVLSIEGWSGDGAYLAIIRKDAVDGERALQLWSMADQHVIDLGRTGLQAFNAAWSPQGDQLAYLELSTSASQTNSWLNIISPTTGLENRVPLPILRTQDTFETGTPQWSPDGRYVSIGYRDQFTGSFRLDVYGRDGSAMPVIAPDLTPGWNGIWSPDGKTIAFPAKTASGTIDWVVYHTDERRREIIIKDIVSGPVNGFPKVLLGYRHNGKLTVEIMSPDGTQRLTVVQDVDMLYRLGWSPSWRSALAVWGKTADKNGAIRVGLTLMPASASANVHPFTLDEDYHAITDLTWLSGGMQLVYMADQSANVDQGTDVGLIDLATNNRATLLNGKKSVYRVQSGLPANVVAYLWKDGQETWLDGFNASGMRLFHILATRALPDRISFAPDGKTAALKVTGASGTASSGGFGLMLARVDGSAPRVLRSGLAQVDDIFWSPDGQSLAFAQITPSGLWTLEVITSDGQPVQSFPGADSLPDRFDLLLWTRCGPPANG